MVHHSDRGSIARGCVSNCMRNTASEVQLRTAMAADKTPSHRGQRDIEDSAYAPESAEYDAGQQDGEGVGGIYNGERPYLALKYIMPGAVHRALA